MKKFFNYAMMLAALTMSAVIVSCSDDDEVKHHDATVALSLSDGLSLDNISNLQVILTSDKGTKDTLAMTALTKEVNLVEGTYNVVASGKVKDEAAAYVTGTGTAQVFQDKASINVTLSKVVQSPLIFKTIYSTCGYRYYIRDGYVEIVNNSDEVQYLDGLIVMKCGGGNQSSQNAWQAAGITDRYPGDQAPVLQFPGSGKEYALLPGESIVVANDAANHFKNGNPDNDPEVSANGVSPDLSTAEWEAYLDYQEDDVDYDAKNMLVMHHATASMKSFCLGVAGSAFVLAKLPEGMTAADVVSSEEYLMTTPGITSTFQFLCIPSKWVLDAVEVCNANKEPADLVPFFLSKDDAMAVKGSAMYSGGCVRRKVARTEGERVYYQDTNNSSNDFENGQNPAIL